MLDILDAAFNALRAWGHGHSFWKAFVAFLVVAAIFSLFLWLIARR